MNLNEEDKQKLIRDAEEAKKNMALVGASEISNSKEFLYGRACLKLVKAGLLNPIKKKYRQGV